MKGLDRTVRSAAFLMGLAIAFLSHAQTSIHRLQLSRVSYEYVNLTNNRDRCLTWGAVVDETPTLQYSRDGRPFAIVRVSAYVKEPCRIRVDMSDRVEYESRGRGIVYFSFLTTPPASTFVVQAGRSVDRILVDAPVRKLDDVGLFQYFKRSQIYFEARYASLSTDNTEKASRFRKESLFPITGGKINFPFPWLSNVMFGVEMHQNLGDFIRGRANSGSSYNELAADLRYQFVAPEKWGRASLGLVVDYRGRNIVSRSERSPISLNYAVSAGGGFDFQSFFPAVWASEGSYMRDIGLETFFRYYPAVRNSGPVYQPRMYGGGVLYRLNNKWTVSFGVSRNTHTLNYAGTVFANRGIVNESVTNYYFRLHLIPFLFEGRGAN